MNNSWRELYEQYAADARITDGWVIAYFFHRVLVSEVKGGVLPDALDTDAERLMELRLFDERQEFRALYVDGRGWVGRLQTDDDGTPTQSLDEWLWVIGCDKAGGATGIAQADGTFRATEAGREVFLPESARGCKLHVRNYYAFEPFRSDGTGVQALNGVYRMTDFRFVGFDNPKEGTPC